MKFKKKKKGSRNSTTFSSFHFLFHIKLKRTRVKELDRNYIPTLSPFWMRRSECLKRHFREEKKNSPTHRHTPTASTHLPPNLFVRKVGNQFPASEHCVPALDLMETGQFFKSCVGEKVRGCLRAHQTTPYTSTYSGPPHPSGIFQEVQVQLRISLPLLLLLRLSTDERTARAYTRG